MEKYSRNVDLRGAYLIDRAAIAFVCRIAKEFSQEDPKIQITLDGNHIIKGDVDDDLLEGLLVQNNKIKEIDITSGDYFDEYLSIGMRTDKFASLPISIRIQGAREKCVPVLDDIISTFNSKRQWYSQFILPDNAFAAAMYASSIAILAITIVISLNVAFVSQQPDKGVIWLEIVAVAAGIAWLKRVMFPKLGFDIGVSSRRLSVSRHMQYGVGVVLILGALASIIGNLVSKAFE